VVVDGSGKALAVPLQVGLLSFCYARQVETVQSAFGDLTIFDGCRTSCPSTGCMMTSGIHEDLLVEDGRMETKKKELICWGNKN